MREKHVATRVAQGAGRQQLPKRITGTQHLRLITVTIIININFILIVNVIIVMLIRQCNVVRTANKTKTSAVRAVRY